MKTFLICVVALALGPAARAWAEDSPAGEVVAANTVYYLDHAPAVLLAAAEDEAEEIFVFGEDEASDRVITAYPEHFFLDTTGKASRDIKRIIGWTLITTGGLSALWASVFHVERTLPDDVYTGAEKYEIIGRIPLIEKKTVYWPSVVAGVGLAAGGWWLMQHD